MKTRRTQKKRKWHCAPVIFEDVEATSDYAQSKP